MKRILAGEILMICAFYKNRSIVTLLPVFVFEILHDAFLCIVILF